MATPFPFTSGQTLLASQMNALTELPSRTITASGTAVAGDAGGRILANGSAITLTIPNTTFTAGQIIEVANINSTTFTLAAGSGVTINTANALTLVQYQAGQLYFTSASAALFFPSAGAAASSGALTLISSTTIGSAVSSVTVSNAFSATYDNYRIIIGGGAGSTSASLTLTLGSTATAYYYAFIYSSYGSSTVSGDNGGSNTTGWLGAAHMSSNSLVGAIELYNPFASKTTGFSSMYGRMDTGSFGQSMFGFLNNTTSYTAFTLTTASGTMTGGTVRVYGYANS